MITRESLRHIIAETFGLDVKSLPKSDHLIRIGNIPEWDSVWHLNLMLAIESHTGHRFDMRIIPKLTNLSAIYEELNGHLNPN